MKKIKIRKTLQDSLKNEDVIRITRSKIDNEPIHCVPLVIGEGIVLVHYIYDFQFDGYKIIRTNDVTSVRVKEIERYVKQILLQEGLFEQDKYSFLSNLKGWQDTFDKLKNLGKNVIIECENPKNRGFYIGKISEVNVDSLLLLNFNALGRWDPTATKINFKEITCVTIENRYINIMVKYIK